MREFERSKKEYREIAKDPEQARAFQAAVRQYQEQFNHVVQVEVRNGREFAGAGLDTSGFALLRHRSAVRDWDDAEEVERLYYAEMRELVRGATAAPRCFVGRGRHVLRKTDGSSAFPPFPEVHSDFTETYKAALVRSLASGREEAPTFGVLEALREEGVTAAQLRASRVLVLQAWRSVGAAPLRGCPLALCDGRSVGRGELIREPVRGLERYRALHSPAHRWYWFPDMTADEVLLFKGYDSAVERYAFHSAFRHPGAGPDEPPRFSCELRLICLLPQREAP